MSYRALLKLIVLLCLSGSCSTLWAAADPQGALCGDVLAKTLQGTHSETWFEQVSGTQIEPLTSSELFDFVSDKTAANVKGCLVGGTSDACKVSGYPAEPANNISLPTAPAVPTAPSQPTVPNYDRESSSTQSINVGWKETQTLEPGHYGDVTVGNEGMLLFDGRGEYVLKSLTIGSGGRVNFLFPDGVTDFLDRFFSGEQFSVLADVVYNLVMRLFPELAQGNSLYVDGSLTVKGDFAVEGDGLERLYVNNNMLIGHNGQFNIPATELYVGGDLTTDSDLIITSAQRDFSLYAGGAVTVSSNGQMSLPAGTVHLKGKLKVLSGKADITSGGFTVTGDDASPSYFYSEQGVTLNSNGAMQLPADSVYIGGSFTVDGEVSFTKGRSTAAIYLKSSVSVEHNGYLTMPADHLYMGSLSVDGEVLLEPSSSLAAVYINDSVSVTHNGQLSLPANQLFVKKDLSVTGDLTLIPTNLPTNILVQQAATVTYNGTITLPEGSFHVGDRLNVEGAITPVGAGTLRIYAHKGLSVNSGSGLNAALNATPKQLVIYSKGTVDFSKGVIKGALVQYLTDGSAVGFTMSNGAWFEGQASVGAHFRMNYGSLFKSDSAALQADFDDICYAGATVEPTELTIEPAVSQALTCESVEVTLKVSRLEQPVTNYEGMINLDSQLVSGSIANGGHWFALPQHPLNGTLSSSSSGAGRYTFVAADEGVVTLGYTNPAVSEVKLKASVSDGSMDSKTSSAIKFVTEGFQLSMGLLVNGKVQAGTYPIANEPFALQVEAIEASKDLAVCQSKPNYNETTELGFEMAYSGHNNTYQVPLEVLENSDGATMPPQGKGALTTRLPFNKGVATPLLLNYRDVGPLMVYMQEANSDLTGFASVTVVPDSVALWGLQSSEGRCGLVNDNSAFAAAGEKFLVTAGGLMATGKAVDGSNLDCAVTACGTPSSACITPSFNSAVTLSAALLSPSESEGATAGYLDRLHDDDVAAEEPIEPPVFAEADYNSGTQTLTDVYYSEVGTITLSASATNVLNSNRNYSSNYDVGRFYPDHIRLNSHSVTPACSSDASEPFSYLGDANQQVSLIVTAHRTRGGRTYNYDNKSLADFRVANNLTYYLLSQNGSDLTARLIPDSEPLIWNQGRAVIDDSFAVSKLATPDGPYLQTQLGFTLVGADGERLDTLDFTCGTDCEGTSIGELAELRDGRIVVGGGYSPNHQALQVPLTLEYWQGERFVPNSADGCSALDLAMFQFDPNRNASSQIQVGDNRSQVSLASDLTAASGAEQATANQGRFWLYYSAPGDNGSITHTLGANEGGVATMPWPEYLQFDWDQDGELDRSTSGLAVFGAQRSSDRVIYRREL